MKNIAFLEKSGSKIESLPVGILQVDHSYQKPLSPSHVKKIVNNFNPVGVGQIHVSKRFDGTYWVFDGQHRLETFKHLSKLTIDAVVYEGMTIIEEAQGYDFYNTTKTQHPLDKEKALVQAKNAHALNRKKIIESVGLEIDYDRTNRIDYIQAMGAIKTIYEKGNDEGLKTVLYILHQALGKHKKNFQAMVLLGLHQFIKDFDGKYEEKWLINRLKKFGVNELISESSTFRRAHNCDKKTGVKLATVKLYNHGKRKGTKL